MNMKIKTVLTVGRVPAILAAALLVTGCASIPSGPSRMALPGTGKNLEQFSSDDYRCRQFAVQQTGGATPNQRAAMSGVGSAAVGAGLGAATGVAIGGGYGAAVGAGSGLLIGGMMGSGPAMASGRESQERYDMGYVQCMYAAGHRVPVTQRMRDSLISGNSQEFINNVPASVPVAPTPVGSFPPPPPPGRPPPPPLPVPVK